MGDRNVRQCRDRWNHYLAENSVLRPPAEELVFRPMIADAQLRQQFPALLANRSPQECPGPAPRTSELPPELASPLPIENWSPDAMPPRDMGTDVAELGEEFWITPMREAWTPDLL
jgi:hypothetical protein